MIGDHQHVAIGRDVAASENPRLEPRVERGASALRALAQPRSGRGSAGVRLREARVRRYPMPAAVAAASTSRCRSSTVLTLESSSALMSRPALTAICSPSSASASESRPRSSISRVAGVMIGAPLATCANTCASHGSTSLLTVTRSCARLSTILRIIAATSARLILRVRVRGSSLSVKRRILIRLCGLSPALTFSKCARRRSSTARRLSPLA